MKKININLYKGVIVLSLLTGTILINGCIFNGEGNLMTEKDKMERITEEEALKLPPKEYWHKRFPYVGRWRRPNGSGAGTAQLISPSWVITAKHVAVKMIADSSRKITVKFGDKIVGIEKAYAIPNGKDTALCKLKEPVTHIRPVALFPRVLKESDGAFIFTKAGGTSGAHDNRIAIGDKEGGIYHFKDKTGSRQGRPGDSGGAWVFRGDSPESDALIGIIHGGGYGRQPAFSRKWITETISESGEEVKWLDVPFTTVETPEKKVKQR